MCYVLGVVQYQKCVYFVGFRCVCAHWLGSLEFLDVGDVQNCCYFMCFMSFLLCAMCYVLCARCRAISEMCVFHWFYKLF